MILVFGKSGQLANELKHHRGVVALGRYNAYLFDPTACANAIHAHLPKVVINAAAYTDVDRAEQEEALVTIINGDAPGAMAQACAELSIPLVHISTDYVFAGNGELPWRPDDSTAPQNAYGRSKLAGEINIRASGAIHAILRTSWIFSAHGVNFVKTMLQLAETRDAISVVADQIGGPTLARDIALACLKIAEQLTQDPTKSGTYHYSGTPDVSWAEFADAIFDQAGKVMTVTTIPTSDYPTPATRPLNSRLDCNATNQVFGILRPNWHIGMKTVLKDLEVIP
jgi:dTDP-4-dehydrorhamnose reductase